MTNWWLIGFLVFLGSGWIITLTRSIKKDVFEGIITLIILVVITITMYMSGMLTELWSVYK